LIVLLDVDVGKHLPYGLRLAGPASPGKHSWATTTPKVFPLPEMGTQSCVCALFQDPLKHVDAPAWRASEVGPVSPGEAELSIRFCLCSPRYIF